DAAGNESPKWIEGQQSNESTEQASGDEAGGRAGRNEIDAWREMDLARLAAHHNHRILQVEQIVAFQPAQPQPDALGFFGVLESHYNEFGHLFSPGNIFRVEMREAFGNLLAQGHQKQNMGQGGFMTDERSMAAALPCGRKLPGQPPPHEAYSPNMMR